jgi:hypothetical protein
MRSVIRMGRTRSKEHALDSHLGEREEDGQRVELVACVGNLRKGLAGRGSGFGGRDSGLGAGSAVQGRDTGGG